MQESSRKKFMVTQKIPKKFDTYDYSHQKHAKNTCDQQHFTTNPVNF